MSEETTNVIDMTEENQPYFNALFLLAAGIRNADAEDTLVGCVQEMLRLRHEVAAMRPLVEAVANDDASVYVDGKTYCGTCHVETWPDEKPHVPGCKVAQAIALAATWQVVAD